MPLRLSGFTAACEGKAPTMSDQSLNRAPLSALERLTNICEGLASDELFETEVDVEEESCERARVAVHIALNDAMLILRKGGTALIDDEESDIERYLTLARKRRPIA